MLQEKRQRGKDKGFKIQGSVFRIQGFRVSGLSLGFRVECLGVVLGFRVFHVVFCFLQRVYLGSLRGYLRFRVKGLVLIRLQVLGFRAYLRIFRLCFLREKGEIRALRFMIQGLWLIQYSGENGTGRTFRSKGGGERISDFGFGFRVCDLGLGLGSLG